LHSAAAASLDFVRLRILPPAEMLRESGEARGHACFAGVRDLWGRLGLFDADEDTPEQEEESVDDDIKPLYYEDRHSVMAEVALEGGDGDPVFFWKVKPGTAAEEAGLGVGDELVQVNLIDSAMLFWRPADEILANITGPVVLWWKKTPPRPFSEKTRMMRRKRVTPEDEDTDDSADEKLYANDEWKGTVSKAVPLDNAEWKCGSCDGMNFDIQEFCRRCGLRDSRLPARPGRRPREPPCRPDHPACMYPAEGVTKADIHDAAMEGNKLSDPTGLPGNFSKTRPRKVR